MIEFIYKKKAFYEEVILMSYQQNIIDAVLVLDYDLNVVDANRSFLRYVNIPNPGFNLSTKLSKLDAFLLKRFLKEYDENQYNKYILLSLRIRKVDEICLFYVESKNQDETFNISIKEFSFSEEVFQNTILLNKENEVLLSFLNAEYIVYDIECQNFSLKNSEVGYNSLGIISDLKSLLVNRFGIDFSVEMNKCALDAFLSDMKNNISDKIYSFFVMKNNINIFTRAIYSNNQKTHIIAIIDTKNRELNNENAGKKDGLTGVYNKQTITEIAKNQIDKFKTPTTLVILDIDNFKEFNDNFGHAFGDEVLIKVAKTLKESVDSSGFVGRIGGDEFLCVINKVDEQSIRNICRNIRLGIQWSIVSENPDQVVSCSMGTASFPTNRDSFDEVFSVADKCLYIAKNKGRNCYVIYTPEKHDSVFVQHKEEQKQKSSKMLYCDLAKFEDQLLMDMFVNNLSDIEILTKLKNYFKFSKISIYDKNLNLSHIIGSEESDPREKYVKDPEYFKYFNENDVYISDNTNDLDAIDKTKYKMYVFQNIASTIEIAVKDENGKYAGLICCDIFKPARTFKSYNLVFVILVLKNILNRRK